MQAKAAALQSPALAGSPWLPGGEPGARIVRGIVRSPADARGIEQIPPADLLAGETILDCIRVAASMAPDKSAIIQLLSSDLACAPRTIS